MGEMITFKDYIAESNGVISVKDAHAQLSSRRWKTITGHKWFADYMHTPQTVGIAIGFKIKHGALYDEIFVAHGPMGKDKLRRMLRFTFYKNKLINIDLYQSWHDELIDGHIKWKYIKQLKKVDD